MTLDDWELDSLKADIDELEYTWGVALAAQNATAEMVEESRHAFDLAEELHLKYQKEAKLADDHFSDIDGKLDAARVRLHNATLPEDSDE